MPCPCIFCSYICFILRKVEYCYQTMVRHTQHPPPLPACLSSLAPDKRGPGAEGAGRLAPAAGPAAGQQHPAGRRCLGGPRLPPRHSDFLPPCLWPRRPPAWPASCSTSRGGRGGRWRLLALLAREPGLAGAPPPRSRPLTTTSLWRR